MFPAIQFDNSKQVDHASDQMYSFYIHTRKELDPSKYSPMLELQAIQINKRTR